MSLVAITGIGVVSTLSTDIETIWNTLLKNKKERQESPITFEIQQILGEWSDILN